MNFKASASFKPASASVILSRVKVAARLSVDQSGNLVLSVAKDLVPVGTGELQSSGKVVITESSGEVTAQVAFTADHAAFVEFGTGLVGEASPHGPLPQSGVPITGSWIYDYKRQGWIGMPAQPYLRPAFDESQAGIRDIFTRNTALAVQGRT